MLTESIDEALKRARYELTDVHGEGRRAPRHSEPPQGGNRPGPALEDPRAGRGGARGLEQELICPGSADLRRFIDVSTKSSHLSRTRKLVSLAPLAVLAVVAWTAGPALAQDVWVNITSTPASGDTYGRGEIITFRLGIP